MWIETQDGNLVNLDQAGDIKLEYLGKKWVVQIRYYESSKAILFSFDSKEEAQACRNGIKKRLNVLSYKGVANG